MRETQGDRDVCMYLIEKFHYYFLKFFVLVNKEEKELFERKKDTSTGQFVNPVDDPNKTLSQVKAKVLQNIDTFFYIGTEVCLY
jgi:hypothetical protein